MTEKTRWQATVAYNGNGYCGWQKQSKQPKSISVQNIIETSFDKINPNLKNKITIHGAGRTDAGVHSLGQVFHFDIYRGKLSKMGANDWLNALNANLPNNIRILNVQKASDDFHARFSAIAKTYQYVICSLNNNNSFVKNPFLYNFVWFLQTISSIENFEQVLVKNLSSFIGKNDFRDFSAKRTKADYESTVRNLFEINLTKINENYNYENLPFNNYEIFNGNYWSVKIRADGFLYKMVRIIVGTSVMASLRNFDVYDKIIESLSGEKKFSGQIYCAPPEGLYLVKVEY